MFKNCARVENEICLCQFGLYTGKSHILRTPNCQQQVHPAQCTAPWRTALERAMLQQWNSRKPWLNPESRPKVGSRMKSRAEGYLGNYHSHKNFLWKLPSALEIQLLIPGFFLAGAALMAPLTPGADTFPSTENTKEAEILSITWR